MAITEQRLGISFELTDEQKALRDLAHEFAEKEIRPREAEYDEQSTHPADVIAKAHEVGLMNLHVPEAYGGPGIGCFDGLLVGELEPRGAAAVLAAALRPLERGQAFRQVVAADMARLSHRRTVRCRPRLG